MLDSLVRLVGQVLGHLPLVPGGSPAQPDVGLRRADENEAVVGVEGGGRQRDLHRLRGQLGPAVNLQQVRGALVDVLVVA